MEATSAKRNMCKRGIAFIVKTTCSKSEMIMSVECDFYFGPIALDEPENAKS